MGEGAFWQRGDLAGRVAMAETPRIDTVRSRTTAVRGRALNQARHHHFVVDAQTGPAEALLPVEVFLAGISACGVHLLERFADEFGIRLQGAEVTISATRLPSAPQRFEKLELAFALAGPSEAEARRLVEAYQGR